MQGPFLSIGTLLNKLPLEDQFYIAKEAGFAGIDYILSLTDLFRNNSKIHQLSKKYEIPIKGIHIPLLLIPYCPEILYKKLFYTVSEFPECEIFNVHLSSFVTPFDRKGKSIKKFMHVFSKQKRVITFESNPKTKFLKYYPEITLKPHLFAEFCNKKNLTINLDTSHLATFDYDINKFYMDYKNNIKLMHISDFDGTSQHLPLGKGNLPLIKLFNLMKQKKYNGYVIFEIAFPQEVPTHYRLQEIKRSVDLFINEIR